jgi:hypothetical protein
MVDNCNIEELRAYFNSITLPKEPIKLNACSYIKDVKLFIRTHLSTVEFNKGKELYLPYLERLNQLKNILENGR